MPECSLCNNHGHLPKDCEEYGLSGWGPIPSKMLQCSICLYPGHRAANCGIAAAPPPPDDEFRYCLFCGGTDHPFVLCPTTRETERARKEMESSYGGPSVLDLSQDKLRLPGTPDFKSRKDRQEVREDLPEYFWDTRGTGLRGSTPTPSASTLRSLRAKDEGQPRRDRTIRLAKEADEAMKERDRLRDSVVGTLRQRDPQDPTLMLLADAVQAGELDSQDPVFVEKVRMMARQNALAQTLPEPTPRETDAAIVAHIRAEEKRLGLTEDRTWLVDKMLNYHSRPFPQNPHDQTPRDRPKMSGGEESNYEEMLLSSKQQAQREMWELRQLQSAIESDIQVNAPQATYPTVREVPLRSVHSLSVIVSPILAAAISSSLNGRRCHFFAE